MQAEKRLVVNNLQEKERHLTQELAHCKEEMSSLVEENKHLASQLNVYQDELKAINEALVIKDAEVWRRFVCSLYSGTMRRKKERKGGVLKRAADYRFQNLRGEVWGESRREGVVGPEEFMGESRKKLVKKGVGHFIFCLH